MFNYLVEFTRDLEGKRELVGFFQIQLQADVATNARFNVVFI